MIGFSMIKYPSPQVPTYAPTLTDINNLGQITGYVQLDTFNTTGLIYDMPTATFVKLNSTGIIIPLGISNNGTVSGVSVQGFVFTLSSPFIYFNNAFKFINVGPISSRITPRAINNNGQIVGEYLLSGSIPASAGIGPLHGLVSDGISYSTLDNPSAVTNTASPGINDGTTLTGVNDKGDIVGTYLGADNNTHSFVYTAGAFIDIADPAATAATHVNSINNKGDMVGWFTQGTRQRMFYYSGGYFANFDIGTGDGQATGLNDLGQVVGNAGGAFVTAPFAHLNSDYRFFDSATGDHFYTTSATEAAGVRATLPSYRDEGAPWSTPDKGAETTDVYRFFDTATGAHFLTASAAERDQVMATQRTYQFEGVAFEAYLAAGEGSLTLGRFYNTQTHLHHYAASAAESASILGGGAGPGWVSEGAGPIVHMTGSSG